MYASSAAAITHGMIVVSTLIGMSEIPVCSLREPPISRISPIWMMEYIMNAMLNPLKGVPVLELVGNTIERHSREAENLEGVPVVYGIQSHDHLEHAAKVLVMAQGVEKGEALTYCARTKIPR